MHPLGLENSKGNNRHLKCNFYNRRNKSAKCPKTWHFSAFYDTRTFHLPRQNPYFCLKWLKIKAFGEWEWYLYPPLYPYFTRVYRDNLKAKLSGWNLLTGLSSIKMNMICCERSSCGEQMDRFWKTLYQFSLQINFVYRFMV